MRPSEAAWIGKALASIDDSLLDPIVELGSSTSEFRTTVQPHIDREIHAPLRERGLRIITTDLKEAAGVEISGDIFDPAVRSSIKEAEPRCVLCCNIFEHVEDRSLFAAICDELVGPGGYLIVTGPHDYPYHADPIDTMYRPTVEQVHALFPAYELLKGEIITDNSFGRDLLRRVGWRGLPLFFVQLVAADLIVYGGVERWKQRNHRLFWLFRPYKQYAVLLRKPV
jgi:hypothetical protein